jgi:hypothetical protein
MRNDTPRPQARWGTTVTALALGLVLAGFGLAWWGSTLEERVIPVSGLTRSVYPAPDFRDPPSSTGRARSPDLSFLADDASLPRRQFSVRWSGFWRVGGDGSLDLYSRADDRVEIFVDDERVMVRGLADGQRTVRHSIRPGAGVHRVRIDYVQRDGPARLSLQWAPPGGPPRPFGVGTLFVEEPSADVLTTIDRIALLRGAARVAWATGSVLLAGFLLVAAVRAWRRVDAGAWATSRLQRAGTLARSPAGEVASVAVLTAAGAILRHEALVRSYGLVPLGSALEAVQAGLARVGPWLHGGRLAWRELGERTGDPVAYLNGAREMTWFYEGLPREPVFIYATRWWLRLTGDADIAVNAASTLFSVLCVPATYLVGRLAFGRAAGLVAAVVVAVEPELIRWGVRGWRDDTFTFFFLLFGASCLLFRAKPSLVRTALLSATASLALLTRLTALSFIAPAMLLLAAEPPAAARRLVVGRLGAASMAAVLLVSPYLVNSWLRTGDALTAINRNTTFYRERAGQETSGRMRADVYLASLITARPVAMADTVLQGLTTYPFRNKFRALRAWNGFLPVLLGTLAVGGLLAWPWSAEGRLLLMLLVCSLLPYAFTWQIRGGAEWRFTMHVYPLFLVAAGSCASLLAGLASGAGVGPTRAGRLVAARAAISLAVAGVVTAALLWMPYPRFAETLAAEGQASISPGWRDLVFFRRDWHTPVSEDGVPSRASRGARARVWMPLPPDSAYRVTATAAASGEEGPPVRLHVRLNGLQTPEVVLTGRFSEYQFDISAEAVRTACCPIEFLTTGDSFRLRSIRAAALGSDLPGHAAGTGADR